MRGSMNQVAILVEGESDRAAVNALAAARLIDLDAHGVRVTAMGGITNVGRHIAELGPSGLGLRLIGLYDAAEERFVRRGLQRHGLAPGRGRDGLAEAGFHCCESDLEDELIRALGVDRVLDVIAAEGDLRSFQSLAQQPAQRGREPQAQLHRFLGSGAGRKIRYGALLVQALGPPDVPTALAAVLTDACAGPDR